jgi:Na+/H+ antiporter NhaD/arsenite permease-like protein
VLLFSMMLIVGNLHLVGFFEWVAEVVIRRLHPRHLLPMVIFTSGILSAFFVNDIICLVMVPFVLTVTGRMRVPALPYLLAVATASNIGSVATITGNPQNILIGSYSGISYRDFLFHLGPVALVGLFLDWAVLHWLYFRGPTADVLVEDAVPPPVAMPQMGKTAIVMLIVVGGFFAGIPPAMIAAVGAAILLIERTREPAKLYKQVDWACSSSSSDCSSSSAARSTPDSLIACSPSRATGTWRMPPPSPWSRPRCRISSAMFRR